MMRLYKRLEDAKRLYKIFAAGLKRKIAFGLRAAVSFYRYEIRVLVYLFAIFC